jgi:hypothetical protein
MTFRTNLNVATLLVAGTLTLSSPPAVAQIACNEWGECWHVQRHYGYGPEWGFNMHPYHWRGGRTGATAGMSTRVMATGVAGTDMAGTETTSRTNAAVRE